MGKRNREEEGWERGTRKRNGKRRDGKQGWEGEEQAEEGLGK
jgi:hypothetical protein